MQLDSIMIRTSSLADVWRLRRAGGEVWQESYQGMPTGNARWRYALVKASADTAIRLQLVALGTLAEPHTCADVANAVEVPAPRPRMRQRKRA
jgi:hypothetical protein